MGLLDDPVSGGEVDADGNPVESGKDMKFSLEKTADGNTSMSYNSGPPQEEAPSEPGWMDGYNGNLLDGTPGAD